MRRVAITIGIQDYGVGSGVTPLRFACADAEAIGMALREHCQFDEVVILTTAAQGGNHLTDTAILTALRDLAGTLNEDDLFLFFFAGHGVEQCVGGQPRSFLLAPNASLQFMTGLLDLSIIREIMARMACAQRIFLLDCCRNDPHEGRGEAENRMTERLTRDIVAATSRQHKEQSNRVTLVMNACRTGERSYEREDVGHGAFSYWLIRGLRDEAWIDGSLEGAQLCRYVQARLTEWSDRTGLKQHPDFQQLESACRIGLSSPVNEEPHTTEGALHIPVCSYEAPLQVRQAGTVHLRMATGDSIAFTPVEPGEFMMGAGEDDLQSFIDERPAHRVRITHRFLVSSLPFTVGQWASVMETVEGSQANWGDLKTDISWDDAQEFLQHLNERIKQGKCTLVGIAGHWVAHLPTEAEWEYANLKVGNIHRESWIGCCWQWCQDWFGDYAYGLAIDPVGPGNGTEKVMRGAATGCYPRSLRPTARGHARPDVRAADRGLRVILSVSCG